MIFQKKIVLRHFWFWEKVTLSNFAVYSEFSTENIIHFQNNVLHDLHLTQFWGLSADF